MIRCSGVRVGQRWGVELPSGTWQSLVQKSASSREALTTGAVSLRLKRMWQVERQWSSAMVDAMGANVEFPLWTNLAFPVTSFLFLIPSK